MRSAAARRARSGTQQANCRHVVTNSVQNQQSEVAGVHAAAVFDGLSLASSPCMLDQRASSGMPSMHRCNSVDRNLDQGAHVMN